MAAPSSSSSPPPPPLGNTNNTDGKPPTCCACVEPPDDQEKVIVSQLSEGPRLPSRRQAPSLELRLPPATALIAGAYTRVLLITSSCG
jgi:hypothetical protein